MLSTSLPCTEDPPNAVRKLGAVASAAAPYFRDGVLFLIALACSLEVLLKGGAY